jgi:hypothetical protein
MWITGSQSCTGTGFSPNFFCFSILIIIPPLFHTYLSLSNEVSEALIKQHVITTSIFTLQLCF